MEVGLECILIYYLPGTTRVGGGSGMYLIYYLPGTTRVGGGSGMYSAILPARNY